MKQRGYKHALHALKVPLSPESNPNPDPDPNPSPSPDEHVLACPPQGAPMTRLDGALRPQKDV